MTNPFSTRFTHPGANSFLYPAGVSRERLLERLEQNHWTGQVVGHHGSGKTTLCRDLESSLLRRFDKIRYVTVRSLSMGRVELYRTRESSLPLGAKPGPRMRSKQEADRRKKFQEGAGACNEMLVIDGSELLSPFSRVALRRSVMQASGGLIATVHRPKFAGMTWLPELIRLQPNLGQFHELVANLQKDSKFALDAKTVASAFETSDGNVRESLMLLYDEYERQSVLQMERSVLQVKRSVLQVKQKSQLA